MKFRCNSQIVGFCGVLSHVHVSSSLCSPIPSENIGFWWLTLAWFGYLILYDGDRVVCCSSLDIVLSVENFGLRLHFAIHEFYGLSREELKILGGRVLRKHHFAFLIWRLLIFVILSMYLLVFFELAKSQRALNFNLRVRKFLDFISDSFHIEQFFYSTCMVELVFWELLAIYCSRFWYDTRDKTD